MDQLRCLRRILGTIEQHGRAPLVHPFSRLVRVLLKALRNEQQSTETGVVVGQVLLSLIQGGATQSEVWREVVIIGIVDCIIEGLRHNDHGVTTKMIEVTGVLLFDVCVHMIVCNVLIGRLKSAGRKADGSGQAASIPRINRAGSCQAWWRGYRIDRPGQRASCSYPF